MKDLNIRYRFENKDTGEITEAILTLSGIENGALMSHLIGKKKVLSRDLGTGLLDKHGKEIFENDVGRLEHWHSQKYLVCFGLYYQKDNTGVETNGYGFYYKGLEDKGIYTFSGTEKNKIDYLEIIGTIYDSEVNNEHK